MRYTSEDYMNGHVYIYNIYIQNKTRTIKNKKMYLLFLISINIIESVKLHTNIMRRDETYLRIVFNQQPSWNTRARIFLRASVDMI